MNIQGFAEEAEMLNKLAADIINFEERVKALRTRSKDDPKPFDDQEGPGEVISFEEKRDEQREVLIKDFIDKNLSPDTKIYDSLGEHELADFAYNGNETLAEYMMYALPDRIVDLYYDIGGEQDIRQLSEDIVYKAREIAKSETKDNPYFGEDSKFLADAMNHYLIKEEYDFGV